MPPTGPLERLAVGALEQKFLDVADGDPARASSLRKAFYLGMALKTAQARRSKAL